MIRSSRPWDVRSTRGPALAMLAAVSLVSFGNGLIGHGGLDLGALLQGDPAPASERPARAIVPPEGATPAPAPASAPTPPPTAPARRPRLQDEVAASTPPTRREVGADPAVAVLEAGPAPSAETAVADVAEITPPETPPAETPPAETPPDLAPPM